MKNLLFKTLFILFWLVFTPQEISAVNVDNIEKIFNIDKSDNYIVYEHDKLVGNKVIHYISYFDLIDNKNYTIYTNSGELINSDMYFPSISKDGKYIVFTSRATNITSDNILTCTDILDETEKYCSNIFLYNVANKKSILIKDDLTYLNGDSYVGKISANGKNIVFESIATNGFMNKNDFNCVNSNGLNRCINIFKYSILTGRVTLISKSKKSVGNANSVSPSISYDGRYISFQSNASNLLETNNELTNDYTNVYLVDTLNSNIKIVSKNNKEFFDNSSGNSKISQNGKYIVYESYASNSGEGYNGKSHIFLYDIELDTTRLISKNQSILNNRDNYLVDISDDELYILYRTKSTNIVGNGSDIYIYNIRSRKSSQVNTQCYVKESIIIEDDSVFYNCMNNIIGSKIDDQPPIIEENQEIYLLKDSINTIKEKIVVNDNLLAKEEIEIYIDDLSIIKDVGEYLIEVIAIDKFENISKVNIRVIVLESDIEGPVFSDLKQLKILKGSSSLNLYEYIEAIDKIDGSTRIYIIDDGNLNLDATGKYRIKLMSKDNADNVSYANLDIIVYDNYNFSYFYEIILILGILVVIIFSIIKVK